MNVERTESGWLVEFADVAQAVNVPLRMLASLHHLPVGLALNESGTTVAEAVEEAARTIVKARNTRNQR